MKKLLHNNFRALPSLLSDGRNKIHTGRGIEGYFCFFIGGGRFLYCLVYEDVRGSAECINVSNRH